jgi:S1-C subfamily serine protease
VLTPSGEVLTNNHVVDGSTSISVTVVSTGHSYPATVVGTDPTDDVAVLRLENASGLATAKIGDSSAVGVGDTVTAVGNAGGAGGAPSSATGTVTALDQPITASDQDGSNPETLTGMIELNADIQAGDSGGPLYASDGTIVGIDRAGSSSRAAATSTGFAIPIGKAMSIAGEIESGRASGTIHLGYPAFLGVQLDPAGRYGSSGGVAIAGVVAGSAATDAGLRAGDTITTLNGTTTAGPSDLSRALAGLKPGQQARLGWVDSSGQSRSATLTLGAGPAD